MKNIKFTLEQALFLKDCGMLDPFGIRDFKDSPAWQMEFYFKDKENPVKARKYCRMDMIEWDKAVNEGAGRSEGLVNISLEKKEIAPGDEWKVAAGLEKPGFEMGKSSPFEGVMMGESDYDSTSAQVAIDVFDSKAEKWYKDMYRFNSHDDAREWIKNNEFYLVHDYWGCGTEEPHDENGEHKSWDYYWHLDYLNHITNNPLIEN